MVVLEGGKNPFASKEFAEKIISASRSAGKSTMFAALEGLTGSIAKTAVIDDLSVSEPEEPNEKDKTVKEGYGSW